MPKRTPHELTVTLNDEKLKATYYYEAGSRFGEEPPYNSQISILSIVNSAGDEVIMISQDGYELITEQIENNEK